MFCYWAMSVKQHWKSKLLATHTGCVANWLTLSAITTSTRVIPNSTELVKLSNWTTAYVAEIDYVYGYYRELNSLRDQIALLGQGLIRQKTWPAGHPKEKYWNIHIHKKNQNQSVLSNMWVSKPTSEQTGQIYRWAAAANRFATGSDRFIWGRRFPQLRFSYGRWF